MDKDVEKIVRILRKCDEGGFCDGCDYKDEADKAGVCKVMSDAADLIERQNAEIDELREKLDEAKLGLIWYSMLDKVGELIEENERLKNRTYNLTLYLRESMDATHGTVGFAVRNVLDERHPGLPGYNPEILEVRHE